MQVSDSIFPELFHALLTPLEQAYGDPDRFSGLFRAAAFEACPHAQAFEDTHRYECSEYRRFAAEARRKLSEARILMDHCYRFRQRVGQMLWLTRELVYEYGGERAQDGHVEQLNQLVVELESLEAHLGRVQGYVEYTHHYDNEMRRQNAPVGGLPPYATPAPAGAMTAGPWGSPPAVGEWWNGEQQWVPPVSPPASVPTRPHPSQGSNYPGHTDEAEPGSEESEEVATAGVSHEPAGSGNSSRKAARAGQRKRKGKAKRKS